jgi:hypothetical protein
MKLKTILPVGPTVTEGDHQYISGPARGYSAHQGSSESGNASGGSTSTVKTKFGKFTVKPIKQGDNYRDLVAKKYISVPVGIVDKKDRSVWFYSRSSGNDRFYVNERGTELKFTDQELMKDYDQIIFKDAAEQKELHDNVVKVS